MESFDYTQLINYGALGVCLVYFIWKDNSTMKKFNDTMQDLKEVVLALKERVAPK